jgi:ABC-type xylose transport system substrate-binding protein
MTDDDKALVVRLRDESIVGMPMENEAADRIETLNAMLKAAEESLGDQLAARKEQADRIEAQTAEIERLREALEQALKGTT